MFRVFGQDFGPARWHCPGIALRFELGVGEVPQPYLATAVQRCTSLMTAVFDARAVLLELTLWPSDSALLVDPMVVLASTGGPPVGSWEYGRLVYEDDGPVEEHRYSVATRLTGRLVEGLTRLAIPGPLPRDSVCRAYTFDPGRQLLFHVYDDRGADLYGGSVEALRPYYERFGAWLLDHNRADADRLMAGGTVPRWVDPLA